MLAVKDIRAFIYHLTRVLFNQSDAYGGKLRLEVSQTIAQYSILLVLWILNSEFSLGKRLYHFRFWTSAPFDFAQGKSLSRTILDFGLGITLVRLAWCESICRNH
ncbi:hypothetical protein [Nostoc sp.]|uniref:hypothetical protein n=1 Tax=Nostoc sp. TaxID=1180 RepID=UPI002FF4CDE3